MTTPTDHEYEMRNCPFCGAKQEDVIRHYNGNQVASIRLSANGRINLIICNVCGCEGPAAYNVEKAVAAWNKRA